MVVVNVKSSMHSSGIPEHFIHNNPKSYWTQDFILQSMNINLVQAALGREPEWGLNIAVFVAHHWPTPFHLGAFMNTISDCGITLSLGKRVNLQLVNRMAALAQKSPNRVHIHTGSLAMPIWNKKAKKYFRMRNTFRSPHIILNKVNI